MVEKEFRLADDLSVGNILKLAEETGDLKQSSFTIVGTVTSGYYISTVQRGSTSVGNGRLGCVVYLCDSVFSLDYYTDIYAVVRGASNQPVFSDKYNTVVTAAENGIKVLADTQKYVRRDAIVKDAEQKLAEAQAEFDKQSADGQKKLDNAKAALDDGERQLSEGRKKLQNGEEDYAQGVFDLKQAKSDYAKQTADAQTQLGEGQSQLDEGQAQYDSGLAELSEHRKTLEDGERQYAEGKQKLDDTKAQLDDAKIQLDDGKQKLDDARAQLDDGWAQYHDGKAQLNDAKAQIDAAQQQIDAGKAQLQAQVDQVWAEKEKMDAVVESEALTPEALRTALAQLLGDGTSLPEETAQQIGDYLTALDAQLAEHPEESEPLKELVEEGRAIYAQYSDEATQALINQMTSGAKAQLANAEQQLLGAQAPV